MTGIDILIQHLQIHLLVLEFIDYLTQMQGTDKTIQSCHHQGVVLPSRQAFNLGR